MAGIRTRACNKCGFVSVEVFRRLKGRRLCDRCYRFEVRQLNPKPRKEAAV